ncbi:ATP-binding protein [Xanthobacter sp. AM11]|uniref:ATP-binding protein n=1 Tax=Xanthobacter sp. AM11 TaxID=3380643 RepID=UPI0039BF414C
MRHSALDPASTPDLQARIAELEQRVAKLEKINSVLIDRAERAVDNGQGSAFSLFQTAIGLERQVRERTCQLSRTLRRLEQVNAELADAKNLAERASRAKTRFLAQAGHDLLQPLYAARLTLSALDEVQTSDEGHRLTLRVERALFTSESLLKSLLDISQLDAGVVIPQVSTVALGQLLSDLANDFAPIAHLRNLDLRVVPSSVHVSTDPLMLKRILQNLVSNALRYTEKGRVLVGVRHRHDWIRIEVIDTGSGIPKDQHCAIFDEFHRGKGAASEPEVVGLGLGLSIVQRLIRTLGHRLALESEVGRGSKFSVELPRTEGLPLPLAQPFEDHPSQGRGLSGALVVVIDNDSAVREATAELIKRWDCKAVPICDLSEMEEVVAQRGRAPDLLLVDYHLDHGSGLDAIAAVHASCGVDVPAIVVTADYSEETEARVAAAGIELLRKPVKPAELRALMAHLLE